MHASDGWSENIYPRLLDELPSFFRSCQPFRGVEQCVMNFGTTANIANLALYKNGRLDCFESRHSFSRLPDVLFERQGGEVENN